MSSLRTFSRSMRLVKHATCISSRTSTPMVSVRQTTRSFSVIPTLRERYYAETHEWIELSDDKKTGSIGISAHAAQALGDIVFVELPEEGAKFKAEDAMGAVESVKSASDLYVPVSGTITEVNKVLEEKPGLINKSPENEGWIAKIELAEGEAEKMGEELMNADDYKKFSE